MKKLPSIVQVIELMTVFESDLKEKHTGTQYMLIECLGCQIIHQYIQNRSSLVRR